VNDTIWPSKWTANVDAWTYVGYEHDHTVAHGRFYWDGDNERSRSDWHPYTNGKNAKQVWIIDRKKRTSKYYVKSGLMCIYFPIVDAADRKEKIGIEKGDWFKQCHDAGLAHYVGREQVQVDNRHEWVDHWDCMIDWQAVNQTITFQIWSSLGLGGAPKSQPLRITGGNSLPNPTLGTPRMTTVWYQNWITGDDANHDADFKAPNFGGRFCLNVGSHMAPVKLEEFFGHPVTSAYTFSSDFHKRAHYLLHAKPNVRDLHRAGRAKPGQAFTAGSFEDAMHKLNEALKADKDLRTERCSNFSTPLLHDTQRALFRQIWRMCTAMRETQGTCGMQTFSARGWSRHGMRPWTRTGLTSQRKRAMALAMKWSCGTSTI
jgi:hypothetical protein